LAVVIWPHVARAWELKNRRIYNCDGMKKATRADGLIPK
jgi:hypothetical protein